MKFDLHCHTKGGSIDSKVTLETYIRLLKAQGFDGMLISDHTTYKGCKVWDEIKDQEEFKDFTVLKGVEYDTIDAGHFLVVLPDDVILKVLHIRGLTLRMLIKIVHHYGGVLGPAHPFGVKSSSAMFLRAVKKNPDLIKEFDFIETFNTCETKESNVKAAHMANKCGLPGIGGSDAHKEEYVGMAYTEIDSNIKCNNDFINAIKEDLVYDAGGIEREATKAMARKCHWSGVLAFKTYNLGLGYLFTPYRAYMVKALAISQ
ncbi:MAG: PHP domain-containing protein [Anaerovoracaceae bacterium]